MRILVTGGSGFIGRNIKESFLAEKFEIVAPTRTELDCADDESVRAFFSRNMFDIVVHSATKPGHRNANDHSNLFLTNSRMLFNLLQHQDRWGKLINMGSGAIYDMQHYKAKMPESYFGTHIPKDEHGYNKYIFAKVLPSLQHVYDFRIFGIFGKYEDYAIRFISNAICKALYDLPITLRQNRRFDYLFIDDLMPVLEHFFLNDPVHSSWNVTPDKSIELLKLAEIVREVSGKNIEIKVAQEGMGSEYSGDNSLLRSEIPGLQFTPIENAIADLYAWYADRKSEINKDVLLTDK